MIPTSWWKKKWAEIEKDFGGHPKSLVERWRDFGWTYRTISRIFDVSIHTLLRWRKFWGLEIHPSIRYEGYWSGRKIDEFTCFQESKVDKVARQMNFEDTEDAIRFYMLSDPPLMKKEIAEKLNCHPLTIIRRTPPELEGLRVVQTLEGRRLR